VKFGIEFVPYKSVDEIVELTKKAEEAGFSYCWITDHYNNRNVYSFLTAIARATERIELGPGVTNPYHIHPAITASAIASVDEISNGRAILGISAGDRTVLGSLGIELRKPLTTISESIKVIKMLLAGERVDFEGEILKLKGARLNFKPKRKIPIYLGAQGPEMLKLAGRISDGVLVNASHPSDLDYAVRGIKRGVDEAGRKMEELDVAAYTSFSISESAEKAKGAAKPVVAFIVASSPPLVLERHGITARDAGRVRDAITSGKFGDAIAGVNDAMLDAFCIYGAPADCIGKIEEILKTGVTQLVVGSPIGPDPAASIEIIRREIMPSFG
jgi:5,10-methylenetetrahydromethanopterin reductase